MGLFERLASWRSGAPVAGWRAVALAGAMLAGLTGCPSPNLYGTPRTVAPGKVTHTMSVDSWGGYRKNSTRTSDRGSYWYPTVPSYTARIGLGERVDMGLRVAQGSSLAGDVKLLMARGSVDLAVAPGLQFIGFPDDRSSSPSILYLHAPLILGVNVSSGLSLIGTAGVLYGEASRRWDDDGDPVPGPSRFMSRFGAGANVRFSPSFAVQPEITVLRHHEYQETYVMGGMGFLWGKLPGFEDLGP